MIPYFVPEVGTNNIIFKAQRNKARRSFQPVKAQCKMRNLIFLLSKAQRKMRNLIFLLSEAQRNFRNELFIQLKCNAIPIAEGHFRAKLKRNLTFAIEISQHNANSAFFAILD